MNRRKINLRKAVIRSLYVFLGAAGFLFNGVHEYLIWILLVFHCYTDCRDGIVYCLPTHICIGVELCAYITSLFLGTESIDGIFFLIVCACGIVFFSRVIHAYAEGDEEIYVMLVLAAANEGRDILSYGIYILGCSGAIFVLCRLCLMAIVSLSERGNERKKFAMEAPMLPAILGAYFLAELLCFI
ncbi:MAG: hypothetical protein ACI4R6_08655 [Lachnospiraceae bacterium]